MFDCANVEMRELLPELASGALDAAIRARVEAHVAECTECAAELETLRLVRAAFANAPAVDSRRIVAALPKRAAAVAEHGASRAPMRRWMDWRIAAALTMITVGGLSVAVTQRMGGGPDVDRTTARPQPESTVVVNATVPGRADSGDRVSPRAPATTRAPAASPEKAQLSFGGGVDDLDRASIEALMGALEEIDRAPIAPPAEPDPVSVLPIITGETR